MPRPQLYVLLIEDDEDDAVLIREWLAEISGQTFTVEWVATYEGAEEALRCGSYDVCLLDYLLGVRSGIELLQSLCQLEAHPPVIVLTGKGDRTIDEQAMHSGAADYLVKGELNSGLLERAIRYALERKRSEDALRQARDELELRVQERTTELVQANAQLRQEIDERQRTEQKLRSSERLAAIGTTVAKLGHEIGNPLNGMSTTLQLLDRTLARQPSPDLVVMESVQNLKHEVDRLHGLLHELRTFARPGDLTLQAANVALIAEELLQRYTPHYLEAGVHVEHDLPVDLPVVMVDPDKLSQVLLNLYKNAVEAMPQGGRLIVKATANQDCVRLDIQDGGVGIPEDIHIFEPFATTKALGTGLGLAIVKQLVEAHGGTITYTSVPGRGTTFTLQFPTAPQPDERTRRSQQ
ncbi:MAG: ATP-binding protein [Candidatus Binatia bacterium]